MYTLHIRNKLIGDDINNVFKSAFLLAIVKYP